MSDQYLLDTNILSDLVRHPHGKVYQRINEIGEDRICTSIIVACELRFGAIKSGSTCLQEQLEQILETLTILPLMPPVDQHYGAIRLQLESAGTPIGPNDLLIAAQAMANELILVTANRREFERVSGLRIENWLP